MHDICRMRRAYCSLHTHTHTQICAYAYNNARHIALGRNTNTQWRGRQNQRPPTTKRTQKKTYDTNKSLPDSPPPSKRGTSAPAMSINQHSMTNSKLAIGCCQRLERACNAPHVCACARDKNYEANLKWSVVRAHATRSENN